MAELRRQAPSAPTRRPASPTADATTLVLVRHGHTADNTPGRGARLLGWTDAPLSEQGREQVMQLTRRLAAEPPDALYASPLRRARETALPLAVALGLPLWTRTGLREIHCGALDGLPVAQVRRDHPALWRRNMAQADDGFSWPEGESYRDFRARCLRTIRRIAAAHSGQRVAVVTHAGVITQVLGALHGTAPAQWEAFRAGNASLTVVRWTGAPGGAPGTLERYDDRSHLSHLSHVPHPALAGPLALAAGGA